MNEQVDFNNLGAAGEALAKDEPLLGLFKEGGMQ